MKRNIAFVGTNLDDQKGESINYFSNTYLLDYDYIIVSINAILTEIKNLLGTTQNTPTGSVVLVQQTLLKRGIELIEFYKHGGTVILLLDVYPILEYRPFAKPGNEKIDLLKIFNFSGISLTTIKSNGVDIGFDKKFIDVESLCNISFITILEYDAVKPMLWTTKTKKPISFSFQIENGALLCLPILQVKETTTQDIAQSKRKLLELLKELGNDLKKKNIDLTLAPQWINSYQVGKESELNEQIFELNKEKETLDLKINSNKSALNNYLKIKSILYLDGTLLEQEVKNCLQSIGFITQDSSDYNVDLLITKDDFIGVIEIKGVLGSAARKHVRQVENWVSNYGLENENLEAKGILIINTYKDTPIEERTEINFPADVIDYSTKRNHCLMLTLDLLHIKLDYDEGLITTDEIIDLISPAAGVFTYIKKVRAKK